MKKILVLGALIILMCGCSSRKIECKYENEKEGNKFSAVMTIKFKGDKVNNITAVIDYESETMAKTMCKITTSTSGKDNVKCDTNRITITNYESDVDEEYLTREKIIEYFEDQKYICN